MRSLLRKFRAISLILAFCWLFLGILLFQHSHSSDAKSETDCGVCLVLNQVSSAYKPEKSPFQLPTFLQEQLARFLIPVIPFLTLFSVKRAQAPPLF